MRRNMINLLKKLIVFTTISILFLIPSNVQAYYAEVSTVAFSTTSMATESGVINPGNFKPPALTEDETKTIIDKGAIIVSVIRVIGIIVTVISLMLIGIKYITGSVEEKADYKKSMIPYLIGVFIFFALSQLLGVIIEIANGINT